MRRLAKLILACALLLLAAIAAEVVAGWRCDLAGQVPAHRPQPEVRRLATAAIHGYLRPEDDTFLSYPEWYIVWSYQEKADFQEKQLPSGFPYFSAVRQYWTSYCCIARLTRGKYGFNGGEQLMLVVIGTSFSAEYLLKGVYEKTVGRFTEWTSHHQAVEEDHYAYQVARDYADFVHIRPFYEFHFARHVTGLWKATPLWGTHPIRKWERKLFLTLDYTAEAFYCWMIEKLTHLTYGREPDETFAWIDNADTAIFQQMPRIKLVKQVGSRAFIVDIPRYQAFTSIAQALAQRNVHFVEIAGNSQVLVSALAPGKWSYPQPDARQLFSTAVLTGGGVKRVVLGCDVESLPSVLNTLRTQGITAEHVYDY